jgi:phage baseplate assembly protein gpV
MNVVKTGRISNVNVKEGCADVIFSDMDNTVETNVPIVSSTYDMPKIDDMVCVVFEGDVSAEQGYIIGKYFNQNNVPDERYAGRGNIYKKLSDNSHIYYDAATDTLEIKAGHIKLVEEQA